MGSEIRSIPQTAVTINDVTITQLIQVLPQTIPFPIKVWVSGELGMFGRTTNNIIFVTDDENVPSVAIRNYFNAKVRSLGVAATIMTDWHTKRWRSKKAQLLALYDDGKLIIDKGTMAYIKVPRPTTVAPVVTWAYVDSMLPETIQFTDTIYITGSVAFKGWSANDVDFIIFAARPDKVKQRAVASFMKNLLGWHCDVGHTIMPEREPVYYHKIYENGARV